MALGIRCPWMEQWGIMWLLKWSKWEVMRLWTGEMEVKMRGHLRKRSRGQN